MAARERAESVYTHIPLLFILLRTLLHRAKRNLFLFKRFRTLCPKTPGGVRSTNQPRARRGPCRSQLFVEFITCPDGVHRTYYWSRRFTPPSYFRVTVPSFPSTFILRGRVTRK